MAFTFQYRGKIIGNNQRYKYRTCKKNSDEYENFKFEVGLTCTYENKNEDMLVGDVEIFILYNSRLDIDNMLKGIFDALEGIVYKNDRQIKRLIVTKNEHMEKGFYLKANNLQNS